MDPIITNSLSGLVGVLIQWLSSKLLRRRTEKKLKAGLRGR